MARASLPSARALPASDDRVLEHPDPVAENGSRMTVAGWTSGASATPQAGRRAPDLSTIRGDLPADRLRDELEELENRAPAACCGDLDMDVPGPSLPLAVCVHRYCHFDFS